MRLIVAQWSYGETTTDRQRAGGESATRRNPCHRFRPTSRGPSGAIAGRGIGHVGANGGHLRCGSSDRPTIAAALPPIGTAAGDAAPLGWAAQGAAQRGTRSGVLGALGRAGQAVGALPDPRRAGATVGTARSRLGGLAPAGSARMAQGGPGHAPPQERSRGAGGVEKKLPEVLAAVVNPTELRGRFVYVYGAVSPLQGDLDWMLCTEMNTVRMGEFLSQVSRAHPEDFIVMILDGASSHKAKDLPVPENIRLVPLPAYAPELNPQEHVWDELREKEFPNRVFNHLDAVIAQLHAGLP